MAHKCTQLVPEHIVKKLVPQDLYSKYLRFLSKTFVENSKTARWCPAPDCGKAIVEPMHVYFSSLQPCIMLMYKCSWEGDNVVGQCSCGTVFCWRCMREAHTPLDCEVFLCISYTHYAEYRLTLAYRFR